MLDFLYIQKLPYLFTTSETELEYINVFWIIMENDFRDNHFLSLHSVSTVIKCIVSGMQVKCFKEEDEETENVQEEEKIVISWKDISTKTHLSPKIPFSLQVKVEDTSETIIVSPINSTLE